VRIACVIGILIGAFSDQLKAADAQSALGVDDNPHAPPLVQVAEDPRLPRVLILGDSISIGYTPVVRKMLAGKANVEHPDANCLDSAFGVGHVHQWIGQKHWDVIYFNFGLHDLEYLDSKGQYVTPDKGKQVVPIKEYQANLRKIVSTLQSTGAKLIFATTTPVPSGSGGRVQGDEKQYNTAAIEVMREMGVETDDLWRVVSPSVATVQLAHNVHFTSDGYRALGAEAASQIGRDLPGEGRH